MVGIVKWLLGIAMASVVYLAYSVAITFDMFTTIEFSDAAECESISLPGAPEDIKMIGDVAYAGIDLRLFLYENPDYGPFKTPNGGMIGLDMTTMAYFNMTLEGFPSSKQFHPLGIDIYKDSIFHMVNLDYASGSDKIEEFRLEGKNLVYVKSIDLDEHFMGQINSVVFVNEDTFYATTWQPFPDPQTGREQTKWVSYKRRLMLVFTKSTYLLKCKVNKDNLAQCEKQDYGYMFNGIATDGTDIFAVDSVRGIVNQYKVLENFDLQRINTIDLGLKADNIEYHKESDSFYVGTLRYFDYSNFLSNYRKGNFEIMPGGVVRIQRKRDKWFTKRVIMQKRHSGTSGGTRYKDQLLLGSWHHNEILICPHNKK